MQCDLFHLLPEWIISSAYSKLTLLSFHYTDWAIGSDPEQYKDDVFPRTRVNFNESQSATIDSGVLYLDLNAFANLSEIIALADGKEEDPIDNLFFFEPGRLLYNSLEFFNFAHRSAVIGTSPNILIRKH